MQVIDCQLLILLKFDLYFFGNQVVKGKLPNYCYYKTIQLVRKRPNLTYYTAKK